MTTLATSLALCASALTMPFASDAERQAMSSTLLRLSGYARELERALDDIAANAEEEARAAERGERRTPSLHIVRGAP